MTHYLYLVRHGEHEGAEHGLADGALSPRGRRQAQALADRLGGLPIDHVWHSPLRRATETAEAIANRLPSLTPEPSALLFDCVPTGMTEETPAAFGPFFGAVTDAEIEAGHAQMQDAVGEFLVRKSGEVHEVLITHNAVIGWFMREATGSPEWRWMMTNQAHGSLTVLAQKQGRPWSVLTFNDMSHLPVELRTGLPVDVPV